jgi:DNA-binding MarR family transcriptional regulator
MKYTQTTLDKIERVLDEAEYIVRYERGNFQSGYCILEQRKVVVLNKFLQMEGRISALIDIIPQLRITPDALTPEVKKIYDDVMSAHQLNQE